MGKKIAIVGSGAIGLYYGGHLAKVGQNVHFLMRSGHEAAKQQGIRIRSAELGEFHLPNVPVYDSVENIGPCDLVIIAVKATSNNDLPHILPPLLKEGTLLLTLQNGLGNEEFLADRWGAHRVLGGLCFVCLTRENPVTVNHWGHGTLSIGEFGGGSAGAAGEVATSFVTAGIEARAVPSLLCERWRKLVWNIPFNGLSVALGGLSVDQILKDGQHVSDVRALMSEVMAIAHAEGCEIGRGFAEANIERTRSMGDYRPSTLVDWEAGLALEIEPIWGVPLRRAAAAGVPVPHLQNLYQKLLSA
ncbi:MAG: 2-dehydropantoate 2-reductase [Terrimicrobiaceae bacterium]